MKLSRQFATFALAGAAVSFGTAATAEIKVGVSLSSTGPAAALGVPERNTIPLLPTEIAGHKVTYIVLDDGTDASQAGKNARKLVTEDNVDILFGSSATPPSLAMAEVADEFKVPQIAAAPVDLPADKEEWVFRAPQHVRQMAGALVDHMKANGVKRLGFIGYADAYGETWLKETKALAEAAGIALDDVERFARNDTSVTGQAVKLVAAKPDAILIAASGTPSVLPQDTLVNRGFKGQIYQTHGTATKEYIRVGGKLVEGTILPVGPVVVASQLPDTHPSKKMGEDYTRRYEEKYGAGSFSSFGAHIYDAYLLLAAAAPTALKTAKPGTPEFRSALRDALEQSKEVVGLHGVFNMSPTDHFGHDARSSTLIRVENGDWKVVAK
ncbi:ABC transporter substrate-binding protein [Neopusillimonas aromaticivorans]|uniref:ABC transporter substrate-binding protein n=1 Tax=Neopusillimonas aromaticivorans TaxID=2979868 RepID=UPI0025924450|nr:ABC transporter substrate-binding protein [Neopusillimonas aromaticivorans]WJJ93650.1 ABC transporter substrate-binding protein [Neopusillimonas aromaticivorans]